MAADCEGGVRVAMGNHPGEKEAGGWFGRSSCTPAQGYVNARLIFAVYTNGCTPPEKNGSDSQFHLRKCRTRNGNVRA